MCLGEGVIGIEGGSMNEYVWIRMRDGYSARGEGSIESWRLYTVQYEDKCFMRGGYMYNCRRIWYEYVQVCDGSRYTVLSVLQYVGGAGIIFIAYCMSVCTLCQNIF